jgi:hypothetical protein
VADIRDRADFALLGDIEFDGTASLFEWCEIGRTVASNSGLIVAQAAQDIYLALQTIPMSVDNRTSAQRRARRVARHAKRAGDLLHSTQKSLAKLPKVFMDEYAEEIAGMRRSSGKTPFNVKDR